MSAFDVWCLAIDHGQDVTPVFQFGREIGPGCAFAAVIFAVWKTLDKTRDLIRARRELRRTPAADDNTAGTNTDDLWTCRHAWTATDHNARTWKEKP